jgi:alkylation response protein AidB-like acyl-CoA dehydrogenase
MDFALNEEQRMFVGMFADFSAKEITPHAEEMDHLEHLPPRLLEQAAEMGFLGATLPEEFDGAQLDQISFVLLLEAIARESASVAVMLATHVSHVSMTVLASGSQEQKEQWLPRMTFGDVIGAFCFTEPDAGCDVGGIRTTVTVEDGRAVLNGVKCWVANAATAGLFLVFAKNEVGKIDAFLVPRDTAGLSVGQREHTLGMRSVSFHTIYLERCVIPLHNRLGEPCEGGQIAEAANQRMAIALAGVALGIASSACDVATDFASERVQFGVPVAQKQAIQNLLAQSHVETESLRAMLYRAAWMADSQQDLSMVASEVKILSAQVVRSVTNDMVQVMGGYGYMEDYPMARKYRDARMLMTMAGPTEMHLVNVARQLLEKRDIEVSH